MSRGTKTLTGIVVTAMLAATAAFTYLHLTAEPPKLELTTEEFEWLEMHAESIRIAPLPDSPPVDFISEGGQHLGLTADYLKLIEHTLGIRFQIIECEDWKEVLQKLRAREVDLVGSVQNTPERNEFLDFTEPYLRLPNIILTRTERNDTLTLDTMKRLSIAVIDSSATYDYLKKMHPNYRFVPVPDATTGFRKLSFMQVDAMITDQGVASYYIEELGITNLRVAGDIDYAWKLCLASRNDWPLLNSILNKTLSHISAEQRRAIKEKWITLSDSVHISRERYLRIVGAATLLTLLAIAIVLFGNRSLRKQVTHHSAELGIIRQSHAQTTRALDESERRFRDLIESSNDMIWEKDRHGSFLYVSPRVEEILGYMPNELIGTNSFSLMPPQEAARNMEVLRTSSVGTTINCDISTYLHRDGHPVILESSGTAYADGGGELAGFRGVSRDITARIKNESALRESEQRFRNLVETTSDWIWEIDTEGIYTYSSPQTPELIGYLSDEILGQHFTENMPPAEAESTRELYTRLLDQGTPIHSLINSIRHKDGKTVVLESTAVPFYDTDWNVQGYRGISRDITDRVATEKRLEFERNLFHSFMENAPDLIYFKDTEGRFIEVNTAKARELNLQPEDLIGRSDFDFFPAEQAEERLADEKEVMHLQRPVQKEEVAITPKGTRWYLTTKVPHYDVDGNVAGTFGTSWDITERKLAVEQLRQLRALLSNTIDSMPSILIGVEVDGTIIQWNRKAEAATGLAPEYAIGRPLSDTFPELSDEMIKVGRAIRERKTQKEERIRTESADRVRYNDITVYPLLEDGAEGAVIRIDDVTDRVLIEDSIRNMVQGVSTVGRSFFKSMVDQLARTLDSDFTFIAEFADDDRKAMRTISISSKDNPIDNFIFDLEGTPSQHVLGGDKCVYIENARERHPDIERLQALGINGYIGMPLVDSGKNALGVMVALYRQPVEQVEFATSIMQVFAGRTAAELERLQATKELLALRNMLENIINSMPSILVGVDAAGHVMQWNHEAENITGISAAEAHGQMLENVFEGFGAEMAHLLENLDMRDMQHHERIHCSIQDEMRIVDVTIYPIATEGADGAVIRLDDVTDRVRIEEMMVQSEKMMSIGGLAAGMAHEINNPLAGILQNLQVIRNRITHRTETNTTMAAEAGTSLEAVETYMENRGLLNMMDSISEAGRRAAKIVDNMLSFSRKEKADYAPNNLEEIVERSIELASNDYNLKKRFDFRHIKIKREFGKLPLVSCEGSQIQQVILNLLSNSAQAMAERPENAATPKITIRLKSEKDTVLLEIKDNGPGMNAETRKRVFEPFFTTKEVGQGTGLGLSVSYFIITENHGGTMTVSSAPGRGSCFSIRLPYEHRLERWGLRL